MMLTKKFYTLYRPPPTPNSGRYTLEHFLLSGSSEWAFKRLLITFHNGASLLNSLFHYGTRYLLY